MNKAINTVKKINRFNPFISFLSFCLLSFPVIVQGWPLDGYKDTGIRRVEGARLAHEGKVKDYLKQVPGALWPTSKVDIRLLDHKDLKIPSPDPELTAQIKNQLGSHLNKYAIAVLDLTDLKHPRYAVHRGEHKQNVGSVGKLVVMLGIFQALADIWPDEAKRIDVLKNTIVTADEFSQSDHHTIRIFDPKTNKLVRRPMRIGDQGTQWEFLDWMISISSNSAAAMNQR